MSIEYYSFLIRIWRETIGGPSHHGDWHGEVEQIQSGACWTIQSVQTLLDLINAQEQEINRTKSQENENGTNAKPDQSNKPPITNSKHETAKGENHE